MNLPPFQRLLDEHRTDVYRFLVAAVGRQSNLRGWLFTIATRKTLDHWRGERRRPLPMDQVPERAAPEPPDGDRELWTAVGTLPPMQRAAVIHRYVLDLSYAEIAEALGISEEAARANAYEGRRKLRSMQEVNA